ncbi:MAG: WHG domain-containing protein [Blastochloris sp.]|nr:WHG domain-containing protein [Blastochloris sp.]
MDTWRTHLHQWRAATRYLLKADDSLYRAPEFAWIPRTFTLAVVMMCDLTFYQDGYQLDTFLDEAERDFGGFDALILWHAYPRIGFDDRNQFDFYRDMPGGLAGLRALSEAIRASAVGRSGFEALHAMCHAYRAFARQHPGLYTMTLRSQEQGDPELQQAGRATVDVVLATLQAYNLPGDAALHAVRYVRSVLHGFVSLEVGGASGCRWNWIPVSSE